MRQHGIRSVSITDTDGVLAARAIIALGGVFFNIEYFFLQDIGPLPAPSCTLLSTFQKTTSLKEIRLWGMSLSEEVLSEWASFSAHGNPGDSSLSVHT